MKINCCTKNSLERHYMHVHLKYIMFIQLRNKRESEKKLTIEYIYSLVLVRMYIYM